MRALWLILAGLWLIGSPAAAIEPVAGHPDHPPRLGVVLSGGGGRGFAHIGVLRALERAGIPVYCLVGSSTGAVIGGLWSCGYQSAEIDSLLGRYSWGDLFRDRPDRRLMYTGRKETSDRHLLEVRFHQGRPQWVRSLSSGQRVSQALSEMVWRAPLQGFGDFDHLRVRFRAVATDIETGRRVELGGGDLAEALRASMSVPFLFQPVTLDGIRLLDGGIADNIPVETARRLGAEVVLAVDVTSPLRPGDQVREAWELADQLVGILQLESNQRSRERADLALRPVLPRTAMDSWGDRGEFVRAGEQAMEAELDHLRRLLGMADRVAVERDSCAIRWWDGLSWRPLEGGDPLLPDCAALPHGPGGRVPGSVGEWTRRLANSGGFVRVAVDSLASGGPWVEVVPNPVLRRVELGGLDALREAMDEEAWHALSIEDVAAALGVGRPLCRGTLDREVDALLERLRRQGFTLADVDTLRYEDGVLRLSIQPGVVDEVRVDGLARLKPGVTLKEFRPRPGELFQVGVADRSISRLYASGLYEQVHLRLEREEGRNRAVLTVAERDFPALRLGLRYGSAHEGEALTQVIWENLLGRSLRGEAGWLVGVRRREIHGLLESDRIWKTWLTTRFAASSGQLELWLPENGGVHRVQRGHRSLQVRLGQQIQGLGSVFASGGLEWDEEEAPGREDARSFSRLGLLSRVDSRDRSVLTRKGEFHEAAFEQLVPWSDDGEPAFRLWVSVDSWRSLGAHTGQLSLMAGTTDSPLRRDHFEFGGDAWLRSLAPAEVSGRRVAGAAGTWRVVLGRPWPGDLSLSLRWSALGLTDRLDEWLPRAGVVQEAGVALHVDSVVGELAFGLARLTDRGPAEDPGARIWLELGHPF